MAYQRTSYYSNYNCRPTYAWIPDVSGSTTIVSGGAGSFDDFTFFTAGEIIVRRDPVYVAADGKVYKTTAVASALTVSGSFDIGFAVSGALADAQVPVDTRHGKVLDGFTGLQTGDRYFLSESYGKISTLSPSNAGSMIYQVGIAKSSSELIFYPELLVRLFDS